MLDLQGRRHWINLLKYRGEAAQQGFKVPLKEYTHLRGLGFSSQPWALNHINPHVIPMMPFKRLGTSTSPQLLNRGAWLKKRAHWSTVRLVAEEIGELSVLVGPLHVPHLQTLNPKL